MEQSDDYYRIEFSEPFEADMDAAYLRLSQFSYQSASRWQTGLLAACFSLERFPRRCRIIPASEDFQREVRQLNYRDGGRVYPILFTIFEATADSSAEVRILRIRQGAYREPLEEAE